MALERAVGGRDAHWHQHIVQRHHAADAFHCRRPYSRLRLSGTTRIGLGAVLRSLTWRIDADPVPPGYGALDRVVYPGSFKLQSALSGPLYPPLRAARELWARQLALSL